MIFQGLNRKKARSSSSPRWGLWPAALTVLRVMRVGGEDGEWTRRTAARIWPAAAGSGFNRWGSSRGKAMAATSGTAAGRWRRALSSGGLGVRGERGRAGGGVVGGASGVAA